MYIDSTTGGGQPIRRSPIKYDIPIVSRRRRNSSTVIFLAKVKTDMVEVEGDFIGVMNGTRVDEGEFNYLSPDRYLSIINLSSASGIYEDTDETNIYAIPLNYVEADRFVLTNIFASPERI